LHSRGGDADHNESGAVFRFILDSVYMGMLSEFRMVSILSYVFFSVGCSAANSLNGQPYIKNADEEEH